MKNLKAKFYKKVEFKLQLKKRKNKDNSLSLREAKRRSNP